MRLNINDKEKAKIKITKNKVYYNFAVEDNGPRIAKENQDKIFEIFKVLASTDKFGGSGNGIGLATVKKNRENERVNSFGIQTWRRNYIYVQP